MGQGHTLGSSSHLQMMKAGKTFHSWVEKSPDERSNPKPLEENRIGRLQALLPLTVTRNSLSRFELLIRLFDLLHHLRTGRDGAGRRLSDRNIPARLGWARASHRKPHNRRNGKDRTKKPTSNSCRSPHKGRLSLEAPHACQCIMARPIENGMETLEESF